MPFCTNCGAENPLAAKFCANCGTVLSAVQASCTKCGKTLEQNEKFCSTCGTPVKTEPPKPPVQPKPEKPKLTKEGRKIISGVPKPDHSKNAPPPPPKKNHLKKNEKKKGGCFFRTLLILLSIVLVSALLIFVVNVLFVENDETPATIAEKTEIEYNNGLTGTNIPGIVDIEPGDVSHLPENRNKEPEQIQTEPIKEEQDIKKAAKKVEDAFVNADTEQIKLLLTESGLSTYSGILKEIQPHLAEYGKAFKNRKLITSTDIYQVYEFYDEKGGKYTAAFELQPDGDWKLTRF